MYSTRDHSSYFVSQYRILFDSLWYSLPPNQPIQPAPECLWRNNQQCCNIRRNELKKRMEGISEVKVIFNSEELFVYCRLLLCLFDRRMVYWFFSLSFTQPPSMWLCVGVPVLVFLFRFSFTLLSSKHRNHFIQIRIMISNSFIQIQFQLDNMPEAEGEGREWRTRQRP